FSFDGDELQLVRKGEQVGVIVRRVCEIFGIDFRTQQRKLRNSEWANTVIMTALDESCREFKQLCLDIDSYHGWLFTIHASKVKPEQRPKLIRYQRECARVLRDHFFGRPGSRGEAPLGPVALLAEALAPIVKLLEAQGQAIAALVTQREEDLCRI